MLDWVRRLFRKQIPANAVTLPDDHSLPMTLTQFASNTNEPMDNAMARFPLYCSDPRIAIIEDARGRFQDSTSGERGKGGGPCLM